MEAPPPLKEEDLDRPEPLMLDPTLEHQVQWADVVAKFCKELRPVHPEGSIFDINQMEFIPSEEKDKLAHLAMARNEQTFERSQRRKRREELAENFMDDDAPLENQTT